MTAFQSWGLRAQKSVRQIPRFFFAAAHNSFALLGILVLSLSTALVAQPDLRHATEVELIGWLQSRHFGRPAEAEVNSVDRATAVPPQALSKQQAAVAYWLSKKYHIAPEPLSALVREAYEIGQRTALDPLLLLSVMAIESGFNPFAQSPVGAQGLMQVMTQVHREKYEPFGGKLAAFDPVTNLRVGALVLQESIQRAGSIEGGLRFYVGAANLPDDSGYASKVLAEHDRLSQVAAGHAVPVLVPPTAATPTPAKGTEVAARDMLNS